MIDALWGERAPNGAAHTIQVFVSQLRKALRVDGERPPEELLVTQGRGYVLRTEPEQVDLNMFEAMVDQGRKALADRDPGRASALLSRGARPVEGPAPRRARGRAVRPAVHREDRGPAAVRDARIASRPTWRSAGTASSSVSFGRSCRSSRCASGCGDSSCWPSTDPAVRPRRSRPIGTRGSCSPTSWGSTRRPTSNAWRGRSSGRTPTWIWFRPPSDRRPPHDRHRETLRHGTRRVWLALVGAALVVVAVAALVIVATVDSGTSSASAVAPNSVGRIDAATDELVAAIPTTGTAPGAVVWAQGSLWVANTVSRTVARIDPATNRVVQTVPSSGAPTDLAAGDGMVWVLNGLDGTVLAIDPRTNEVTGTTDVPVGSGGIAVGAGAVWVTDAFDATVVRIDPETRQVVETDPSR